MTDNLIGCEVRILKSPQYKGRYFGELGVVERTSTHKGSVMLGVRLEKKNTASSYGLFWFDSLYVEVIESVETEEIPMLSNYITAGVKFLSGSNSDAEYIYALYDRTVQVDDLVVVNTGHHGIALAKISSIGKYRPCDVQCNREVICKVDMTAFEQRKAKARKLADLKRQMDMKVREFQNLALYELIAASDPALGEMLSEYKALMVDDADE